jgi:hypothetical protein
MRYAGTGRFLSPQTRVPDAGKSHAVPGRARAYSQANGERACLPSSTDRRVLTTLETQQARNQDAQQIATGGGGAAYYDDLQAAPDEIQVGKLPLDHSDDD